MLTPDFALCVTQLCIGEERYVKSILVILFRLAIGALLAKSVSYVCVSHCLVHN